MTSYYEREEWPAFLAAIRAAPDDDLPRLVAADWLDELETEEAAGRAAWVRHHLGGYTLPPVFLDSSPSLEWLPAIPGYVRSELPNAVEYTPNRLHTDADVVRVEFSRGFVTRVSAPLGVLHSPPCRRCGGRRRLSWSVVPPSPSDSWHDPLCDTCHGNSRTAGVLGELLRREPVTAAGIMVTDATPIMDSGLWFWGKLGNTSLTHAHWLPDEVWQMAYVVSKGKSPGPGDRYVAFTSEDAARLALGEALYRLHGPKSEVMT